MKKKIIIIVILVVLVLGLGLFNVAQYQPTIHQIDVEAGSSVSMIDYLKEQYKDETITMTKLSDEDLKTVGNHEVKIESTQNILRVIPYKRTLTTIVKVVDTTKPKIHGVKDVRVPIESSYQYKKDITTSDNSNGKITLKVDTSDVNLDKEGTYKVTYTATDESKNSTTETMNLTVYKPDNVQVMHTNTLTKAEKVLSTITTSTDSEETKMKKAFEWTRHHGYTQFRVYDASKTWPSVYANDYFDKGRGDCHSGAAAFAYLALAIGKQNVVLCTDVAGAQKGAHSWAEVDGLCYDPLFSMMKGRKKGMQYNYAAPTSVYSLKAGSKFPLQPRVQ